MKHVRFSIANPVFAMSIAVSTGLLAFVIGLVGSAKAITSLIGGPHGLDLAVTVCFPCAVVLAVLSFILAWKKL
jgi:hypothetical protein